MGRNRIAVEKEYERISDRLTELCSLLIHAFRLPPAKLTIDFIDSENFGLCYPTSGEIHMRITNYNHTRCLSWQTNLDTLCHELAHMVVDPHNAKHRRLTLAMKEWASRNGFDA